jgi:hypothetical protein
MQKVSERPPFRDRRRLRRQCSLETDMPAIGLST